MTQDTPDGCVHEDIFGEDYLREMICPECGHQAGANDVDVIKEETGEGQLSVNILPLSAFSPPI